MKIKSKKAIFEYYMTEGWWLMCENGDPKEERMGIWWLARKIDRSYKGKGPDLAVPSVQLNYGEMSTLYKKFKLDKIWV